MDAIGSLSPRRSQPIIRPLFRVFSTASLPISADSSICRTRTANAARCSQRSNRKKCPQTNWRRCITRRVVTQRGDAATEENRATTIASCGARFYVWPFLCCCRPDVPADAELLPYAKIGGADLTYPRSSERSARSSSAICCRWCGWASASCALEDKNLVRYDNY